MKKNKWIKIVFILLIPFVSIIVIIEFRHRVIPTNEEIIKSIISNSGYKTLAEVNVYNELQEHKECVDLYYKNDVGHRINFNDSNISKIYTEDKIEVKEKEYIYSIDKEKNDVYSFLFIEELLKKDIESVQEKNEEWDDTKYLEIMINVYNDNSNFDKAKVYINKKEKTPIVTKVYDKDGKERNIIVYKKFTYSNKINSKQLKYDNDGASNMAPV